MSERAPFSEQSEKDQRITALADEYTQAYKTARRLKYDAAEAKSKSKYRKTVGLGGLLGVCIGMAYIAVSDGTLDADLIARTSVITASSGLATASGLHKQSEHRQLSSGFDVSKQQVIDFENQLNAESYLRIFNASDNL